MNGSAKRWAGLAIAMVLGFAVGAGAVWLVLRDRIDSLEASTARLDAKLEAMTERLARASTPPSLSPAPSTPTAPSPTKPMPAPVFPKSTERQFALIKSISLANKELVADYGQFLTGEDAARAAEEAGGESPPPNDFYIVNDNPKLRTLNLSPQVLVRLTTSEDNAISEGYVSSLDELAAQVKSHPEWNTYRWYWLTIKNGTVYAIQEQYIP